MVLNRNAIAPDLSVNARSGALRVCRLGGSCDFNLLGRVRQRVLVEPFCFRGFYFRGDKFCGRPRFYNLASGEFYERLQSRGCARSVARFKFKI